MPGAPDRLSPAHYIVPENVLELRYPISDGRKNYAQ